LGTFEATGLPAMRGLGLDIPFKQALAFIIACHTCQYIPTVPLALIAMELEAVDLSSVRAIGSVAAQRLSATDRHKSEKGHG